MAYRLFTDTHFLWIVPNDEHPLHHSEFAPPPLFSEREALAPAAVPDHWNHARHTLLVDRQSQAVYVIDSDTGDTLNALCPPAFAPVGTPQEIMRFPLPSSRAASRLIEGLAGACYLMRGLYLILVTHARPVGSVGGRAVLEVLGTELLPVSAAKPIADLNRSATITGEETHCVAAMQRHLDASTYLFARDYDLTLTAQKAADYATIALQQQQQSSSADPPAPWLHSRPALASEALGRAEDTFFANRPHVATLLHAYTCSLATLVPSERARTGVPSGLELRGTLHGHPAFSRPSLREVAPYLCTPPLPSRAEPSLAAPFTLILVSGAVTTAAFSLPSSSAAAAVSVAAVARAPPLLLTVTTLHRRSRHRSGGRLSQRGVNARGHAGAHAETEQIFQLFATVAPAASAAALPSAASSAAAAASGGGAAAAAVAASAAATAVRRSLPPLAAPRELLLSFSSFVVVRGSAPVPFTQRPGSASDAARRLLFPLIAPPRPNPILRAFPAPFSVPPAAVATLTSGAFGPRVLAAALGRALTPPPSKGGLCLPLSLESVFPPQAGAGAGVLPRAGQAHGLRALAALVATLDHPKSLPAAAAAAPVPGELLRLDTDAAGATAAAGTGAGSSDSTEGAAFGSGWSRCLVAPASLWHLDGLIRTYTPLPRIAQSKHAAAASIADAATAAHAAAAAVRAIAPPAPAQAQEPLLHVVSLLEEGGKGAGTRALNARVQAAVAAFNWAWPEHPSPPTTTTAAISSAGGGAAAVAVSPSVGIFPVTPDLYEEGYSATASPALGAPPEPVPAADGAGALPPGHSVAVLTDASAGVEAVVGPPGSVYSQLPAVAAADLDAALSTTGAGAEAEAGALGRVRGVLAAARACYRLAFTGPAVAYHSIPLPTSSSGAAAAVAGARLAAISRRCGVFTADFAAAPLAAAAAASDAAAAAASVAASERGAGLRLRWPAPLPLGAILSASNSNSNSNSSSGVTGPSAGAAAGAVCGVLSRVTVPAPLGGPRVLSRQHAVARLHCLDCIDRTGKAQALMLAAAAATQAAALGLGGVPTAAAPLPVAVSLYDSALTPAAAVAVVAVAASAAPASVSGPLSVLRTLTADGSSFHPGLSTLAPSPFAVLPPAAAAAAAVSPLPARVAAALLPQFTEANDQLALAFVGTRAVRQLTSLPAILSSSPSSSPSSSAAAVNVGSEASSSWLAGAVLTGATHSAHRLHTALLLPYKPFASDARSVSAKSLTARVLARAAAVAAGPTRYEATGDDDCGPPVPAALVAYVRAHPHAVSAPPSHLPLYLALQVEAAAAPMLLRARSLLYPLLTAPIAAAAAVASATHAAVAACIAAATPQWLTTHLLLVERARIDRLDAAALGDDASVFRTAYRPVRHLLHFSGAQIVRDTSAVAAAAPGAPARYAIEPLPAQGPAPPRLGLHLLAASAAAMSLVLLLWFLAPAVPVPTALTAAAAPATLLQLGLLPVNLPHPDALLGALRQAQERAEEFVGPVAAAAAAPLPQLRSLLDVISAYERLQLFSNAQPVAWRLMVRQWSLWRLLGTLLLLFVVIGVCAVYRATRGVVAHSQLPRAALSDPVDFGPPTYAPPPPPPPPAALAVVAAADATAAKRSKKAK